MTQNEKNIHRKLDLLLGIRELNLRLEMKINGF